MHVTSVKKVGGTFNVGKVVDGVYLEPEASKHNDLLPSFLYRTLNKMSLYTGSTKIGDDATPNSASLSGLVGWKNVTISTTLHEKTVTFDEVTRLLTIRQTYRSTGALGAFVGTIREVGRQWFNDTTNSVVDARAVLETPIEVGANDQFYVDYVAELVVEMPPAVSPMIITYPAGDLTVDVSFRIEDVNLISMESIFRGVDTATLSYFNKPLSEVKPQIIQYINNTLPTTSRIVVGKVINSKVIYGTAIGNGDWGSGANFTGLMALVQANGNFSYQFSPGLPKDDQLQLEFNFVQDFSAVVTL